MKTIRELEAEVDALKQQIESLKKQRGDRPEKNEPYFEIEPNGAIGKRSYSYEYDEEVFRQGNGFRTAIEAKEEVIRRGAVGRLRKMQNGYVPDRCGQDTKYTFRLYEHAFEKDWTCSAFFPGWFYYRTMEERDDALATLTAEEISAFLNWGM